MAAHDEPKQENLFFIISNDGFEQIEKKNISNYRRSKIGKEKCVDQEGGK
jgi:hypothetical protein